MEINLSVVIVQQIENKELLNRCIASIKKQQYKNGKAVLVGGEHSKAELLNKGLELGGETEFVLFINTHEELKDGYLDKCLSVFQKYPVGAVYTDYDKAYLNNIREYLPSFSRSKITQGWFMPTTAIFKREVFNICGNFDSSLNILENWDMWMRASEVRPLYHLPESLYLSNCKIEENVSSADLENTRKYILEKAGQRTNAKQ